MFFILFIYYSGVFNTINTLLKNRSQNCKEYIDLSLQICSLFYNLIVVSIKLIMNYADIFKLVNQYLEIKIYQ